MARFASYVGFLFAYSLHIAIAPSIPKPFVSTSLTCYTYRKVNGRITKRFEDDCIFSNTCCYAVEFTNAKTGEVVESGGCEDEYRHLISTHPMFAPVLSLTATYLCEEGACIERMMPNHGSARLCACVENNCNTEGINGTMGGYHERIRMGTIKKPPDYANIFEKTIQILVDG